MPVKPNAKFSWNKATHRRESSPVQHLWPSPSTEHHQCTVKLVVTSDLVLCKPVCTHLIYHTGSTRTVWVCVAHTPQCGASVSHGWPQNLLGVFVNSVPTPGMRGQHVPLYFSNKVSLLSHILCAMAHELVDPGCIEGCEHSNSVTLYPRLCWNTLMFKILSSATYWSYEKASFILEMHSNKLWIERHDTCNYKT